MKTPEEIMEDGFYYLKEGEVVQEGDEVEVSNNYNDPPKWVKATCIGTKAPNPHFIAHRIYRRKPKTTDQ